MEREPLDGRTSSSGADNGARCLEAAPIPVASEWRTSSFSGENGGSCVEVVPTPTRVAVRDTKDRSRAPHLHPACAWRTFITAVRNGEFDRP